MQHGAVKGPEEARGVLLEELRHLVVHHHQPVQQEAHHRHDVKVRPRDVHLILELGLPGVTLARQLHVHRLFVLIRVVLLLVDALVRNVLQHFRGPPAGAPLQPVGVHVPAARISCSERMMFMSYLVTPT